VNWFFNDYDNKGSLCRICEDYAENYRERFLENGYPLKSFIPFCSIEAGRDELRRGKSMSSRNYDKG